MNNFSLSYSVIEIDFYIIFFQIDSNNFFNNTKIFCNFCLCSFKALLNKGLERNLFTFTKKHNVFLNIEVMKSLNKWNIEEWVNIWKLFPRLDIDSIWSPQNEFSNQLKNCLKVCLTEILDILSLEKILYRNTINF